MIAPEGELDVTGAIEKLRVCSSRLTGGNISYPMNYKIWTSTERG